MMRMLNLLLFAAWVGLFETAPRRGAGNGPWLGLAEAANYLGVSTRTLRNYVSRGDVPASRMVGSRLLRFRVADLDAMLRPVTSSEAS